MPDAIPDRRNDDPRLAVVVPSNALPWMPSPEPGVERRILERRGGEVARATSIVRYAPGSSFAEHVHDAGEEFLVLAGVFSDGHGDFPEGTYVRNPPGSAHRPFSREGCTIFVKLRQMSAADRAGVVVRTATLAPSPTRIPGLGRIPLHLGPRESVAIEVLEPGAAWRDRGDLGGEEILVVSGTLVHGDHPRSAGTWIRRPGGIAPSLTTNVGCRLWVKRGHLPAT